MNYHKMTEQAKRLSGSRKREFGFYPDANRPQNTASYWDGGSKTSYTVINMLTGQTGIPPCGSYPTFQASYTLQPQELLMETGIFAGKPGTARFNCRSEDEELARKFLGIEACTVVTA
ncbi:MAG TPA: hypothetical protein VLK33_21595 [Terriglobales bacterium]|nr:hypothetical protein [Terriglobales bacterium]